jgi:protocatechuate 3,4-dioxygenase beta subunit
MSRLPLSRRDALLFLSALPLTTSVSMAQSSTGTANCAAPVRPTRVQTEGPYFKRNAPSRADLATDDPRGERLRLQGIVVGRDCGPVPGAVVDLWQTDSAGAYDNAGFRLRGNQLTAANGSFAFETVVPGLYPGRTRHLHVKIAAPGRPVLTTQLYFPGEPGNATDRIFDASLVMAVARSESAKVGTFTFVLP